MIRETFELDADADASVVTRGVHRLVLETEEKVKSDPLGRLAAFWDRAHLLALRVLLPGALVLLGGLTMLASPPLGLLQIVAGVLLFLVWPWFGRLWNRAWSTLDARTDGWIERLGGREVRDSIASGRMPVPLGTVTATLADGRLELRDARRTWTLQVERLHRWAEGDRHVALAEDGSVRSAADLVLLPRDGAVAAALSMPSIDPQAIAAESAARGEEGLRGDAGRPGARGA